MPEPELGQGASETAGKKSFDETGLKTGVTPQFPLLPGVAKTHDDDPLEPYTIAESHFFDCLQVDQFGAARAPLPPALVPKIELKFRTFDARLEAKYGVRNYQREIARYYDEIDEAFARLIPGLVRKPDTLAAALNVIRMYSEAHVFDVQVRRTRKGGRQEFYIRSLEPRSCVSRVAQFDLEDEVSNAYEDNLLCMVQREIFLGKHSMETMLTYQPFGFTYHAMLRLWERGRADGRTFHLLMAHASERLRGITAMVELCHADAGMDNLPSQIAVPMLDGFLVASKRQILARSEAHRWAVKRDRHAARLLVSQDQNHFANDAYVTAEGRELTLFPGWFASTFMGANDLGDWERVFAAERFEQLIDHSRLDEYARYREWLDRSLEGLRPPDRDLSLPGAAKVLELQREMLPRAEVLDDRWHLLNV